MEGWEFRVSGFGFRASGFGFRISGSVFRVSGFGFRVKGEGLRVKDVDLPRWRSLRPPHPPSPKSYNLNPPLDPQLNPQPSTQPSTPTFNPQSSILNPEALSSSARDDSARRRSGKETLIPESCTLHLAGALLAPRTRPAQPREVAL